MEENKKPHENDPAFIADLLSKLRQQMEAPPLETTAAPDAVPEGVAHEAPAEEKSESTGDVVVRPTKPEQTKPAPVATEAPAVPSAEGVGEQFVMDIPMKPEEPENDDMDTFFSMFHTPVASSDSDSGKTPRGVQTEPAEPEQLELPFETLPPTMPVPDDLSADAEDKNTTTADGAASESTESFVWDFDDFDTFGMDGGGATESSGTAAPATPSDEHEVETPTENSEAAEPEVPVDFHATRRVPRHTLADVDFDATGNDGRYRDKILQEPLESIGGEHAEEQLDKWERELATGRRRARMRLIIATALVAFLALFELVLVRPLTSWSYGTFLLIRVPGVVQLFDMQLLILVCLIGHRPLYRGFAALRFGRVMPETLASFSALASLLASIVFYLVANDAFACRYLFALSGAFVVLGALFADYCRIEALSCAFRTYTAEGKHRAAVFTDARAHRLLGKYYGKTADVVHLLEIEPVEVIDGFVAASRSRVEERRTPMISLILAGVVALADLIVLLVLPNFATAYAFWSAVTVFLAVLPLSAFLLHRFLFWMLSARISRERIGVTGEDAVYQYAKTQVMTYDDTEAFPNGSVRVTGIKLCGDFPLDKALYLVSGVFDRVGGPLNGVFKISTSDVRISEDVVIRELSGEGINAFVNREDVCVGTRAHLESIGVEVYRDIEDDRAEQDGNRILYVAYRGFLVAKFYVTYEISTTFEKNVEFFAKRGIASVIMTADPLLNASVLDRISYISDYDVRFEKYDLTALEKDKSGAITTDLITYGPRKTLRRMPYLFKKYKKYQGIARVFSLSGIVLSATLAPLLVAALRPETVLWVFLCQLVVTLPAFVVGFALKRINLSPQASNATAMDAK